MRKLTITLLIITTLAVMLLTAGCVSRDDELVGTWVSEDAPTWVTTFNSDGTGTHTRCWGYGTEFRWATTNSRISWNYPGHRNMETRYRVYGDVLYITTVVDGGARVIHRYIREK